MIKAWPEQCPGFRITRNDWTKHNKALNTKALKGMVYVTPDGIESDEDLAHWVGICEGFVQSLPLKMK